MSVLQQRFLAFHLITIQYCEVTYVPSCFKHLIPSECNKKALDLLDKTLYLKAHSQLNNTKIIYNTFKHVQNENEAVQSWQNYFSQAVISDLYSGLGGSISMAIR